jgi:hypothetical protein
LSGFSEKQSFNGRDGDAAQKQGLKAFRGQIFDNGTMMKTNAAVTGKAEKGAFK